MSARHKSARTIRRALDVLLELPAEALADLAERLIDKLDAAGPDSDSEADDDGEFDQHGACECGDDDACSSIPQFGVQHAHGPGDPADGEPDPDREPSDGEAVGEDDAWHPGQAVVTRRVRVTRAGHEVRAPELVMLWRQRRLREMAA